MKPEETKDQDRIQALLIRISHLYFLKMFQQLSSTGVHPGQLPMINLLGSHEGLSQKEIAERLKIKPPTVNVSLKRMEHAGFIERRADERDQRVSRIYLSGQGRDIYGKMKIMLEYNEQQLLQGFTESELCLLQRFFKQMLGNLEQIPVEGIFEVSENRK